MASSHADPFGDAAGSFGDSGRRAKRLVKRFATTAAASYTGNVAAAATTAVARDDDQEKPATPPDRAEARPGPMPLPIAVASSGSDTPSSVRMHALPSGDVPSSFAPPAAPPTPDGPSRSPSGTRPDSAPGTDPILDEAPPPRLAAEETPLPPIEPEWYDGEEVYTIYRPSDEPSDQPSDAGADDTA